MKNIRHIFFDLDNTLWDHRKNAKLTLEKLFSTYQIQQKYTLDFEAFHRVYHTINEELWARLRDEEIDKDYLRKHRFYDAFLFFNIDNFELAQEFEHRFLDEIIEFNEVIPGAYEILDYLQQKKYHLHIITNGFKEVTYRKIEGSNMKQYFQTITSADEVGVRKPNAKIFQHGLEVSGAQLTESILIGDDWIADVKGAQQFGMKVIFFNVLEEDYPQDNPITIKKLSEIKNLL